MPKEHLWSVSEDEAVARPYISVNDIHEDKQCPKSISEAFS